MKRFTTIVIGMVAAVGLVTGAWADEKTIATHKAKDVIVTLKNDAGQWKEGTNSFVLEFTSAADQKPVDAGKVALNTSMSMPGMAPMLAGAKLTPDKAPGRYLGTISFPDKGARQVTVTWDGPARKGSTKFSVSVR
jgi:YtkA-like protein